MNEIRHIVLSMTEEVCCACALKIPLKIHVPFVADVEKNSEKNTTR